MKIFLARFALAASLVMPVLGLGACSSDNADDTVDADNGKTISGLDIGGDITIDTGATKQLSATVEYADGSKLDVTSSAQLVWNIGDTSNATISNTGLITGVSGGTTTVKATYQGKTEASHALIVH